MPRKKKSVPIERYTVKTLAEVGREMGISAMRVQQLQDSAFKKIRSGFTVRLNPRA